MVFLLFAALVIRVMFGLLNVGGADWGPASAPAVTLRGPDGARFARVNVAELSAGRVLPSTVTVASGEATRGHVAFSVPKGVRPDQVEVAIGGGLTRRYIWRLGDQD